MSHDHCAHWKSISHKFEIKILLIQELGRLSVNTPGMGTIVHQKECFTRVNASKKDLYLPHLHDILTSHFWCKKISAVFLQDIILERNRNK